ncbi:bifunctional phosphoribosylaminoimidazole carboxylase/phosphoribosylaminoimidazole succinocarboxamide synthetase isoform X1 [Bubalus kerabau]|uniref:bifunctional phosphoribosylaminoimidazole carboxylase/phosphoribosylaminoimidazole succinocarboxamide synthetase isoform X1 n=1 Tax=Bubalus carabanensis TaxID=3119969 RepID=UPI00244E5ECD|nr:bifunctional phosphoribosylaminoimidazole carboxylase/phosphoribosylaminoimidazole succinocarboxamide synthetase isoform X1 [Bubalus carabanensis]
MESGAGKHWTEEEVKALLSVWAEKNIRKQLYGTLRNKGIFIYIAKRLRALGVYRDWKQCRAKYKNLKYEYRTVKYALNSGDSSKTMKFFHDLDAILQYEPATPLTEEDANDMCLATLSPSAAPETTEGKMSVTSEDKEDISGNPLLLVSQVRPMELGDSTAIMEPPNNSTVIPTVANEGGKHWTVPEVRALIGIWSDQGIQQQLEGTMRNKRIFEQIAAKLQKLGIERDWKQCRTKYKNLKHEYKIVRTARDLGMAKSMKFFTELDAILGHKKTENSQQESQDEEQATGCAHVKMEEDQTVIAGDAVEDALVSNMSEELRETDMRQSPCTEEDTASNASDEVGGPTAPHGIPGSELFENHTKNPREKSIKRKALEDESASISLKKTASETAANQFPQRTTEPKDSSEYFCSQETPYVTQLHQSPASLPCVSSQRSEAEALRPLRTMAAVEVLKIGKKLYEGKTKEVYELLDSPGKVLLQSKDQITAGNAARKNHLEGKAAISNKITSCIFQLLQEAGIKTAFTKKCGETAFIAPKCEMIPIEWVCRRIATGSFLKRNPGVKEGYKFYPPKVEMFFKDDANNDPQWSEEQLIAANFCFAGLVIGQTEVDIMSHATQAIFEILEKSWLPQNCTLVDMKIEFGVDVITREIVLADVIDNDSWRLWPSGDRSQQKDKQSYRDLKEVTPEGLQMVKKNFEWVAERVELLLKPESQCRVIVLMGSTSDLNHCEKIKKACGNFGIPCELRVTSAHKGPDETLRIKAEYEGDGIPTVFVAVAGRSNGLGPVLSGNTAYPVISCPPLTPDWGAQDVWSSLRLPSGLGCSTILSPEGSAQFAAQIFGLNNHLIWARLRASVLNTWISLKQADKKIREASL